MLKINGKTFMNIQEAVQWLLDNNALPFQSSADYIANTEIGLGTIVNPSPAKVRIGSLIFFADSKVSTVTGLTENGFIVSDQYNNLVDDIVYVSNVALNASGHLIVTLSNGNTIDAGLIKQVTGFSINASQHLIVTYNDGTTTDLGAIFSGNITVSGNLNVAGGIYGNSITGNSIIETMSGYSMSLVSNTNVTVNSVYGGIVKNGNKLTIVIALNIKRTGIPADVDIVYIGIPSAVGDKLFVSLGTYTLAVANVLCVNKDGGSDVTTKMYISKENNSFLKLKINDYTALTNNEEFYVRTEFTFLLSDSLLS